MMIEDHLKINNDDIDIDVNMIEYNDLIQLKIN
jgi:hypothetical protein